MVCEKCSVANHVILWLSIIGTVGVGYFVSVLIGMIVRELFPLDPNSTDVILATWTYYAACGAIFLMIIVLVLSCPLMIVWWIKRLISRASYVEI